MPQPPEQPAFQSELYKLGWVRGFHGKEPRPARSQFPSDQKHRQYVTGYAAGVEERLGHAWKAQKKKDSN